MTTNMKNYILEDNEELRKDFRDTMKGQFAYDLYNKSFSNQLQSDELDSLQRRIEWWMVFVDKGGPILNNVYGYRFAVLYNLSRKAIDPKMQGLVKLLRDRQIAP